MGKVPFFVPGEEETPAEAETARTRKIAQAKAFLVQMRSREPRPATKCCWPQRLQVLLKARCIQRSDAYGCKVGTRDTTMGNGFGRFRANGTHRFWDATDCFCKHERVHACSQQATERCYLESAANGRENQKVDPTPISLSRPT